MNQDNLWVIASASVTHYREASFGGGRPSSSMSMHYLCWDPANEAFVTGDHYGWGTGNPCKWKSYPCERDYAAAILDLCATSVEVQQRFLENSYSLEEDKDLFGSRGYLVHLRRTAAISDGRSGYLALAGFGFWFLGPDCTVHRIGLNYELTQGFLCKLKVMSPETIRENLNRVRAAA